MKSQYRLSSLEEVYSNLIKSINPSVIFVKQAVHFGLTQHTNIHDSGECGLVSVKKRVNISLNNSHRRVLIAIYDNQAMVHKDDTF